MKTQKEIADAINKTPQCVNLIFLGKRRPSYATAKKLTEVLGQDPLWWMESSKEDKKALLKNQSKEESCSVAS